MVDQHAIADGRSMAHLRRSGLFRVATVFGVSTAAFVAVVALRVGLVVLDRHFSLPGVAWDVRYFVESVGDTVAFAVLYVVVPVAWAGLAIGWWLTHPPEQRRIRLLLLTLAATVGLFGAWAWLVTAVWHIRWAFEVDGIPQGLGSFGITEADRLEPLVVAGLSCLIGLVVANLAVMVHEAGKR